MFWGNRLARCGAMRPYWWLCKALGELQPIKKQGIETHPRTYIIRCKALGLEDYTQKQLVK